MMNKPPAELSSLFHCKQQKGWIGLFARGIELHGFGTRRIAKYTPLGEIEFTIGATEKVMTSNLNGTIRILISSAGLEVIERNSTSGSRNGTPEYPAFSVSGVSGAIVETIVHRVEGAILQVQYKAAV
jgi:hypothetical protein